jgi:hypothetical protein
VPASGVLKLCERCEGGERTAGQGSKQRAQAPAQAQAQAQAPHGVCKSWRWASLLGARFSLPAY